MKKAFFWVLSVFVVLSLLSGCAQETVLESPGVVEGPQGFSDGTYVASSEANERGYVVAEVRIEGGSVAAVSLTEYEGSGVQKGEEYGYDSWHEAMKALPGQFVAANSAEVDGVSGATSTSTKAMEAVSKALQRSAGFDGSFDGTFMGTSDMNERGWGVAWVTLEGGEIASVQLKEVTGEGQFKDTDYPYESWQEAVKALPDRFIEKNAAQVDIFTGATSSSEKWIQAVEMALENAGR